MRAEHGDPDAVRAPAGRAWHPVTRVHRTEAELTFTFELPGVGADRICVSAEHDVLTVHAAREPQGSRSPGPRDDPPVRPDDDFLDRFPLPPGVDPASIRADHADGVLAVRVPNPARFRQAVVPLTRAAAAPDDAR